MKILYFLFCITFSFSNSYADFPYFNLMPDWESEALGKYGTGLELADINGDGLKDIIVANGNDMARQKVEIYYNRGDGTFPTTPDWESDDIDYNCNISVADIDSDGFLDVAVSVYLGEGGFDEAGLLKIYYNKSGELEKLPSFVVDSIYTFSCKFGDADADGDLDLAVAVGEMYTDKFEFCRIYYNIDGQFNKDNFWQSESKIIVDDVSFADFDGNGFLDLLATGYKESCYIFLANNNGVISPKPCFIKSQNPSNKMHFIQHDIGLVNQDGKLDFVTCGNYQAINTGDYRLYTFSIENEEYSFDFLQSDNIGYGSEVLLADINHDDKLDLLYGSWWSTLRIVLDINENFNHTADFVSESVSVIEQIKMADLTRKSIKEGTEQIVIFNENAASVRIKEQIPENITEVWKNGEMLPLNKYSTIPGNGIISFVDKLVKDDVIDVIYEYSTAQDIVISNWDETEGNYIFYNKTKTDVTQQKTNNSEQISISPNPASDYLNISLNLNKAEPIVIIISDVTGNILLEKKYTAIGEFINDKFDVSGFISGVYFIQACFSNQTRFAKFLKY